MKPPTMRSSLTATLLLASSLPTAVNAEMLFKGCYKSVDWMKDQGSYTYQSTGYCLEQCQGMDKPVFGLWKGSNCLCGDKLPSKSKKVSKDQCNVACDGWPDVKCGGKDTYSVYLVDASDASSVETMSSGSSETTTTTGGSSATEDPASTKGGQTSVETTPSAQDGSSIESSSSSSDSNNGDSNKGKSSGESDTAAIAAGVVVGVVGFCALLGAGFLLWRFKKRRAQPNYLNTGPTEHYNKPMSASSNSRFDGDFMAQRRQSNGSIDDDQDFSRRILQVTNPDR